MSGFIQVVGIGPMLQEESCLSAGSAVVTSLPVSWLNEQLSCVCPSDLEYTGQNNHHTLHCFRTTSCLCTCHHLLGLLTKTVSSSHSRILPLSCCQMSPLLFITATALVQVLPSFTKTGEVACALSSTIITPESLSTKQDG